jgi:hypothetical protein
MGAREVAASKTKLPANGMDLGPRTDGGCLYLLPSCYPTRPHNTECQRMPSIAPEAGSQLLLSRAALLCCLNCITTKFGCKGVGVCSVGKAPPQIPGHCDAAGAQPDFECHDRGGTRGSRRTCAEAAAKSGDLNECADSRARSCATFARPCGASFSNDRDWRDDVSHK